jgi:hypothetical protein
MLKLFSPCSIIYVLTWMPPGSSELLEFKWPKATKSAACGQTDKFGA